MSIVQAIGDFFRGGHKDGKQPADRFAILSPLLAVQKYVETTQQFVSTMQSNPNVTALVTGHNGHPRPAQAKAIDAYRHYVQALSGQTRQSESKEPFVSLHLGLDAISKNLSLVEDHITDLFDVETGIDETNLRTSSLMVVGYIETASDFYVWIGTLFRHLTADEHEGIPPFETKNMTLKASELGSFVSFNLDQWNGHSGSILTDIRTMQRKGLDVAIKTGDNWLDAFVQDSQFTSREQSLMNSSFRNPILMYINWDMDRRQAKIELLNARNEWLVSKIDMESRKMQGLDPASPEYRKLKQITDHYANVISQHEQKIGRLRS